MDLSGKKILITGATGFIGSRLVEALGKNPSIEVRALVHQFMNASRLARFPVRMLGGSIVDPVAVDKAMQGVDVVFHLAFGTTGSDEERRGTTVEGTRVICEAALRAGVSRVVHTSTFSVYGRTDGAELTEESPRKQSGDVYADSKLEAENLVLDMHGSRALPAVVLQPTIVYGPFSFWGRWPIEQLQRGAVVLPDNGAGVCNAVYVDDVVNALICAATVPSVEGQTFLISGDRPCTWLEYDEAYGQLVENGRIELMPYDAIRHELERAVPVPGIGELLKRGVRSVRLRQAILAVPAAHAIYRGTRAAIPKPLWNRMRAYSNPPPDSPGATPPRERCFPFAAHLDLLRSPTRVRIDKALGMLDWQPRVPLATGVAKTGAWAGWFGLIA